MVITIIQILRKTLKKILVDENGEEVPNLGLHFNENGKASYQIYIPKTGSYNLSYVFTHSDAVNLNVKKFKWWRYCL